MELSIIIVNYNTKQLTLQTLDSVFASKTDISYEVLLVDNHSTDGSVDLISQKYKNVILISNKANVGFAKANNQALRIARGKYVLLLNSDTIVSPDTFEIMIKFMGKHVSVGAAGCKVVLPNGKLDKACRRGFPTPSASFYYAFGIGKLFPRISRFNRYHMSFLNEDEEYPIDCLVGAFMLVRRETIDQVGLLDEGFFMYGEDIDWCYRIKQAGWDIYYYPRTQIIHYKGASSRRKPIKIVYEFHRAMLLFYKKHFRSKYSVFTSLLVYFGITIKCILAILLNAVKKLKKN